METIRPRHRFLIEALLASLLIHLVVALLLPPLALVARRGPPVETLSFVHVPKVTIALRKPVIRQTRSTAPRRAAHPQVARHPSQQAAAPTRSIVRKPSHKGATVAPVVGELSAGTSASQTAPTAAPQATPTAAAARQVANRDTREAQGGYLPLGAMQPVPVLDPDVRKELVALGVHVTLTITVGEDGKTKSVAF